MTHKHNIFTGCLVALTLAASAPLCAQTSADISEQPLKQYAEATRSLYERVSTSVVRVRVDQSPESLIPPQMRKDFPQWRDNFLKRGMPPTTENNPTVIRIEPKSRGAGTMPGPGSPPPPPPPGPMPLMPESEEGRNAERRARLEGAMGDHYAMVKRFLENRAMRVQDPETLAKLRQGIIRAEALRGEHSPDLAGVVLDDQGHVLIMMTLLREATEPPIKITTADNREFTATFVGADYLRGFSILKMSGESSLPPPLELAKSRPQPGELLMCLSVNTGAIGWITTPGPGMAPRRGDERFAIFGEDQGSVFLFNIAGKLAAVGSDHYALPVSAIKTEIAEVKNKGFVSRRQFGVRHTIIGMDSPLRSSLVLGHKPAIRVDDVFRNSLAERAGLKKDDIILTIDGRSITQLPRILQDLAGRTDDVKMGIIRDDKELELILPLDKPTEKKPGKRD